MKSDIHAILDNYAVHKHPAVRKWLARHPRWVFHFTPTSASRLNAREGFFAIDQAAPQARRTVEQSLAFLMSRPQERKFRLRFVLCGPEIETDADQFALKIDARVWLGSPAPPQGSRVGVSRPDHGSCLVALDSPLTACSTTISAASMKPGDIRG